jgi:hypothetical protein
MGDFRHRLSELESKAGELRRRAIIVILPAIIVYGRHFASRVLKRLLADVRIVSAHRYRIMTDQSHHDRVGTPASLLAKYPWFKVMVDVFTNATARPSTVTGADYNQLSTAFFQNVNKVLIGDESTQEAVSQVERQKRIVR